MAERSRTRTRFDGMEGGGIRPILVARGHGAVCVFIAILEHTVPDRFCRCHVARTARELRGGGYVRRVVWFALENENQQPPLTRS